MSSKLSGVWVAGALVVLTATAAAGTVTVKLDLPPAPPPPPLKVKGFLERMENPIAPVRGTTVAPQIDVVLEPATPKTDATGQVTWELLGDSFNKPLIAVPQGSELVIKNPSKTSRNLVAAEDGKLVPAGPLNPTGVKSFRLTEAKVYTIVDKDAAHVRGTVVVVPSAHAGNVDANNKLELTDVPEGAYKARVFYKDRWIAEKPVTVPAKGKVEVAFEQSALPLAAAPKK